MIISVIDIQKSFDKYLEILQYENIIITKNNQKIACLKKYEAMDEKIVFVNETNPEYLRDRGLEISYDEFLVINRDCECRYEYINGYLVYLTSPSYSHQKIIGRLFQILNSWFKGKKCEPLFSPFDVTLFCNKKTHVVQPDVLVICDTEKIDKKGKYSGIPSLVVEILSPSTQSKDLVDKLEIYRKSGVSEYWIINHETKIVSLYNFKDNEIENTYVYKNKKVIESITFKGLCIDINKIFS